MRHEWRGGEVGVMEDERGRNRPLPDCSPDERHKQQISRVSIKQTINFGNSVLLVQYSTFIV